MVDAGSQIKTQYAALMTEIIKKQIIILGPDISLLKARSIPELRVSDDGTVVSVGANPAQALQQLIDAYVDLSGLIVKNAIDPLMKKYPTITSELTS